MAKMHRVRFRSLPSPSVAEPRRPLLLAAYSFVRAASSLAGVRRMSLLGSLVTAKAIPKDVDLLVTIDNTMDLTQLARAGGRLMGSIQSINLAADVFLADVAGRYLGRICSLATVMTGAWWFGICAVVPPSPCFRTRYSRHPSIPKA